MNDKLYELSKQAGFNGKYDFPFGESLNPAIEKFAELIVRECINICEQGTSTQMTSSGAADMFRQHFGVK